jgi:hypothetical protein
VLTSDPDDIRALLRARGVQARVQTVLLPVYYARASR